MDLHNIERLLVMRLEGLRFKLVRVQVMATLPKYIKLLYVWYYFHAERTFH